MLHGIDAGFKFFIALGGPAIMFIVITLLAMLFRVKFSKALEGGLRMAMALIGMTAVMSVLTSAFGPAVRAFARATGTGLDITDLGWAPLAVITWGSLYTLYFALVEVIVNLIMLYFHFTNTLNVDLFNVWNLSLLGLLINYYAQNMIVTTVFIVIIVIFMLLNSDTMKPTINYMLHYKPNNVLTTAHPEMLIAAPAMILDKLIKHCLPFLDKFDFNAKTLTKKVGFWGSNFAIGAYLGIFIGLVSKQSIPNIFKLAFIAGVTLQLFSYIGTWFAPAIKPLSDGVENFVRPRIHGRRLYIGIDWWFIGARPEIWAVCDIVAPILILIAIVLPGNKVLPLGGILLTIVVPATLIVTKGRVIRMTLISTILIPLYLWAATLISTFVTKTSAAMGNIPKGLSKGQYFTAIDSDPLEKMSAILFGKAAHSLDAKLIIFSAIALILYTAVFIWYRKEMRKDDKRLHLKA